MTESELVLDHLPILCTLMKKLAASEADYVRLMMETVSDIRDGASAYELAQSQGNPSEVREVCGDLLVYLF